MTAATDEQQDAFVEHVLGAYDAISTAEFPPFEDGQLVHATGDGTGATWAGIVDFASSNPTHDLVVLQQDSDRIMVPVEEFVAFLSRALVWHGKLGVERE